MTLSEQIELFQRALNDEVKTVRENGGQKTYINDGRLLGEKNGVYLYSFIADSEIHFPDDTQVDIEQKNIKHPGMIISIEGFDLILSCDDFLGAQVPFAILFTSPWFLLEELINRLDELESAPVDRKRLPGLLIDQTVGSTGYGAKSRVWNLLERIKAYMNEELKINEFQRNAVEKVLSLPLSFIWGPPGTGKTSTLGLTAAVLLESGAKILILAHSNVAVDVALLSMMKYAEKMPAYADGEIIRLGVSKDPGIEKYPQLNVGEVIKLTAPPLYTKLKELEARRKSLIKKTRQEGLSEPEQEQIKDDLLQVKSTLAGLNEQIKQKEKEILKKAKIIGCTLSKATISADIYERRFDAVLIDEASMAYIPHCFYASSLANQRVAIYGDFRQLAPISQADTQLANQWLKRDIFDKAGIIDRVNRGVDDPRLVLLRIQYRMHPAISFVPNSLFYQNKLRDAPDVEGTTAPIARGCPKNGDALVYYDLTQLPAHCFLEHESHSRFNFVSALASVDTAIHASQEGLHSVGIISPYNAQSRLIHRLLIEMKCDLEKIRVGTVHKYQGLEQEVIVFDVTEGEPNNPGLLISRSNDTACRLANVAISRARGKIIFLANQEFIRTNLPIDNGFRRVNDTVYSRSKPTPFPIELIKGNRIAFTDLEGVTFYPTSSEVKGEVERNLSDASEEIAINWPVNQAPYFSPYTLKVCNPTRVRFFFTGEGKMHFQQVGLQNVLFWDGIKTPEIGLVGIDRKILWIFPNPSNREGFVIRLDLRRTIELLYAFWKIVPDRELQLGTQEGRIEQGNGPIGLPCPQCRGILWLASGRYGDYLQCTNGCGFTRDINDHDATDLARLAGKTCDCCGGQVIGRRRADGTGVFLGCCNYPKCRWTMPIKNLL